MEIAKIGAAQAYGAEMSKALGAEAKQAASSSQVGRTDEVTFSDLLAQVTQADATAQRAAEDYAAGQNQNVHETMLAMKKADITFSLLVTVRNKMLEAYQTVMRMS
jgi:flagellar hook-basal body complex protein FliE